MSDTGSKATAGVEAAGDKLVLKVGGTWRLTEAVPRLKEIMPGEMQPRPLKVVPDNLTGWDSSLPMFLLRVRSWCRQRQASLDISALPDALKQLFALISESEERQAGVEIQHPQPHTIRRTARRVAGNWKESIEFVGECAIASGQTITTPRHFSWKDFLVEMTGAGPRALPIIGLLSFLIGLTFAFETATQLKNFGASAFVVQGTGVAVLRQIGPIIAAVLLAGRTGAAYAARMAEMKIEGALDALELLGVSPVQFLVLPRVAALVLMTPLITLYSDLFGVLGGLVIAVSKLDLSPLGFWVQLQSSITLRDLNVGIVKGVVFGLLVALAGTLRGLQSERSSAGVGRAVTSAVVTGIAAIICADALFSPVLKKLGW